MSDLALFTGDRSAEGLQRVDASVVSLEVVEMLMDAISSDCIEVLNRKRYRSPGDEVEAKAFGHAVLAWGILDHVANTVDIEVLGRVLETDSNRVKALRSSAFYSAPPGGNIVRKDDVMQPKYLVTSEDDYSSTKWLLKDLLPEVVGDYESQSNSSINVRSMNHLSSARRAYEFTLELLGANQAPVQLDASSQLSSDVSGKVREILVRTQTDAVERNITSSYLFADATISEIDDKRVVTSSHMTEEGPDAPLMSAEEAGLFFYSRHIEKDSTLNVPAHEYHRPIREAVDAIVEDGTGLLLVTQVGAVGRNRGYRVIYRVEPGSLEQGLEVVTAGAIKSTEWDTLESVVRQAVLQLTN